MNTAAGVVGGLVVGAAIGYGAATLYKGGAGSMGLSPGGNPVVMELDGTKYKESDLPSDVRSSLYEAKNEAFERENGILSQFALQFALAKDKNKDVKADALPPFDQLIEAPAPSDQDMQALYEANKARLPPNTPYEQIKPEIERYLKNQKVSEALRAKNEEFKAKNRLKLLATAPEAPKVDLKLDAYAAKGNGTTLVEVADYLCPHCQASQPEVEALLKDMGDKVKFVAVPFSLSPEGLSGTLARGAFCARQQSDELFWKWHSTAFDTAKTKGWKASDPDNKDAALEVAAAAGLDKAKFEPCLASPEAANFVKTTVESMHTAGVSGTPTFFMNNRKLSLVGGKSLKENVQAGMAASH